MNLFLQSNKTEPSEKPRECVGGIFTRGEYILALRLTSELVDLRAGYANSHSALCAEASSRPHHKQKNNRQPGGLSVIFWSKWRDSNSRPPVPEASRSSPLTTFIYFLALSVRKRCFRVPPVALFPHSPNPWMVKGVVIGLIPAISKHESQTAYTPC